MPTIRFFIVLMCSLTVYSQNKAAYLVQHRYNVESPEFVFPQTDFTLLGFGAYHGSAKTYAAEFQLLKSLKAQNALDVYIPEVNFSQAYYFQHYLETGDEDLLKELVYSFQSIVQQEGTIETFQHWQNLRQLYLQYPENPIQIIGCDLIVDYHFPVKQLLALSQNCTNWAIRQELQQQVTAAVTAKERQAEIKRLLTELLADYQNHTNRYAPDLTDRFSFEHLLTNIQYSLAPKSEREPHIVENYLRLKAHYQLQNKKQFAKYGFFHVQKTAERNYPSFFTRLIEQNVYTKAQVITVMGYLTQSEVLWDKLYNDQQHYSGYTTEKGFGIGDYWKEYFKGIRRLKKAALSDLTLFHLNAENSPYHQGTDLVEVKLFLKASNGKALKGKATTDFIDYALLIRHSAPQIPLEELEKR